MRLLGTWFWMSAKRYLHRISFAVILLILPMGTFLIHAMEDRQGTEIRIAVYAEGMQLDLLPMEQQLAQRLASRDDRDSMFVFYLCGSLEQMERDVASRKAECGYYFPADLRKKLDGRDYKRSIRVYSAPSTVADRLASEVVFAEMIRHYDQELFVGYVRNGQAFDGHSAQGSSEREALAEAAAELYEVWVANGSTFHFEYVRDTDSNALMKSGDLDSVLFPVRGVAAVYVLVAGLYGAAMAAGDGKKGLFQSMPASYRQPCLAMTIAAPVSLAAASALAALYSGGSGGWFLWELAAMAGYGAAVTLFSWLLLRICRRQEVICCLIPFFLAGSLIFCPVWIDLRNYLPEFSRMEYLFLPGYYLKLFR